MKWSRWCVTASLNYKNTMINRITMETVACLRSKCHLKQNLIQSWPWSFRHTSCISDFRCKTKYTNKKFCWTPDWQYCRFLWFSARSVWRISKSLWMIWHFFVWSYLTDNRLLNNKDLELFLKNVNIQGSDTPYFVLLLSLF